MDKMNQNDKIDKQKLKISLWTYLSSEVTRGYVLEADEERYTLRRQKIYTFMKIPRELEKFMSYGFFHCLDSFLFLFTFLPIRFVLAAIALVVRIPLIMLGIKRPFRGHVLYPAEIIDLLKGFIIAICVYLMHLYVDTSMLYHVIKSQSVIKLYLFYNMLEVGDRLFSAFGQDSIDALFWTATEPKDSKRQHVGLVPHFLLTIAYVVLHSLLVLLQATTLNVAVNASNKALLTIMMSNNFVEIKGSVFKKFDKNNLFQVSCSDVRERFHLFALLLVVIVQTMKEYGWKEQSFWDLAPDCLWVLASEFFVDWIKHAFITRFNEVPPDVYKDYTTNLAYDLAQTKQKHAFSDHSDIVSRRMGFIPLPLSVVIIRVIGTAVKGNSAGTLFIFILGYLCLVSLRVLCSIVILGKACDLIDQHQQSKRHPAISSSNQTGNQGPDPKIMSVDSQLNLSEKPDKLPRKASPKNTPQKVVSKDTPTLFVQNPPDGPAKDSKLKNNNTCKLGTPKYLSGTASPMPPTSKATTNQELKESAVLLESKIQALFGNSRNVEKEKFDTTPEIKPTVNSEESRSTNFDRIEAATDNLDGETLVQNSVELNFQNCSQPNKDVSEQLEEENDADNTHKVRCVKTKENERFAWSKRRSQLLAAREAATDSRRRPLSCTPPSTSVDQSSIDEDDDSICSSINTTSRSSMVSSTTNTSISSKAFINNTPSKHLLDSVGLSRTSSSSFDASMSVHLEEYDSNEKLSTHNIDISQMPQSLSTDEYASQLDISLNAIVEKETEECDSNPSDAHQEPNASSKLWLPDVVCQQTQNDSMLENENGPVEQNIDLKDAENSTK